VEEASMSLLLRLEEIAQFVVCIVLLALFGHPWWVYLLVLVGPDIGMVGYLINPKIGAWIYNLFHHKGVAILVGFSGLLFTDTPTTDVVWATTLPVALSVMLVLYAHSCLDRIFGYGLKHTDAFSNTHLGRIGKAS